jgi:hypothetical protein
MLQKQACPLTLILFMPEAMFGNGQLKPEEFYRIKRLHWSCEKIYSTQCYLIGVFGSERNEYWFLFRLPPAVSQT